MTIKEIKRELESRGADASTFVEKPELIKALEEARAAGDAEKGRSEGEASTSENFRRSPAESLAGPVAIDSRFRIGRLDVIIIRLRASFEAALASAVSFSKHPEGLDFVAESGNFPRGF